MASLLLSVTIVACPGARAAAPVQLAKSGQSLCELVVRETDDKMCTAAIVDLRDYFKKITGAELPASQEVSGNCPVTLRVGSLWLDDGARARVAGSRYADEAFILSVRTDGILLGGLSPIGTRHGIYRLLREWGCRWYFPGKLGEVVAKAPHLAMRTSERLVAPSFRIRRLWYAAHDASFFPPDARGEFDEWCRRNSRSTTLGFAGHSYYRFVPREKHLAEHPEYLALVHGRRAPLGDRKHDWQPCTSHPDVVRLAVQYAREHLARGYRMVSVSPNDGGLGSFCQCQRCRAQGTISDGVVILANRVADAIADEYPARWVGFYAYSAAMMPPAVELHDNVVVFIAKNGSREIGDVDWHKSLFADANARWKTRVLDPWSDKATHLALRDYYALRHWRDIAYDFSAILDADLPYLHERGLIGINAETFPNWVASGFTLYFGYQKLWNVTLSLEEERRHLYADLFGPVGKHVVAAMDRMQRQSMEATPLTDEDLQFCGDRLKAAIDAAPDDLVRRRVAYVRGYHEYLAPLVRCLREGELAAQIRYRFGLGPAAELRKAILDNHNSTAFWAKLFVRKAMVPNEDRSEATNLRPVSVDQPVAIEPDQAVYRGRNMFAAWVGEEGVLDFTLVGRRVGDYPGPGQYAILVPRGSITQGRPFARDARRRVKLNDIAAGPYWVLVDPGSNAFTISFRNNHAAVETGRIGVIGKFGGPKYFRVPGGTEEFSLTVHAPGGAEVVDFWIRDPDGRVVLEHYKSFGRRKFAVDVPAGQDGKTWSMNADPTQDAELALKGIPPFLATRPERLLTVPAQDAVTLPTPNRRDFPTH